ncbi:MAG: hypothetical protein LBI33_02830 [Propionibacteriaceae bacterium]|jgi:hypothetical protein|nr:hypothetical protein [Propionibacteriaceae bacterium]
MSNTATVTELAPDFLALGGTIAAPPDVRHVSWSEIREAAYRSRNHDHQEAARSADQTAGG